MIYDVDAKLEELAKQLENIAQQVERINKAMIFLLKRAEIEMIEKERKNDD